MTVRLSEDGRAIAWGDQIEGRDIPDPPSPVPAHIWNDQTGAWERDDQYREPSTEADLRTEWQSASQAYQQAVADFSAASTQSDQFAAVVDAVQANRQSLDVLAAAILYEWRRESVE